MGEEKQEEQIANETAPEAAGGEPVISEEDELTALREELEQQKQRARENLEGWQRAQADFANYKRRQKQELEALRQFGNEELLRRLLPLADDFERAFTTLPYSLREFSWIEGLWLVGRKLLAFFEQEGVQPIETKDAPFDPRWHEAVTYEESAEHDEGQIIEEFQRGYRIHDRVLRPALVKVAKAAVASEEAEKDKEVELAETAISVVESETHDVQRSTGESAPDAENVTDRE